MRARRSALPWCRALFWPLLPVRVTISDMGPVLFSRLLGLTKVQEGVLYVVFRIADDRQMLLIDMKDLRSMLNYVGEHAKEYTTTYGNVSSQSVDAILRALIAVESDEAKSAVIQGQASLMAKYGDAIDRGSARSRRTPWPASPRASWDQPVAPLPTRSSTASSARAASCWRHLRIRGAHGRLANSLLWKLAGGHGTRPKSVLRESWSALDG